MSILLARVGSERKMAPSGHSRTELQFDASSPFKMVDAAVAEAMARIAFRRTFSAGQIIYMQDDNAACLHVVVSGYVRLSYLMEDGSAILYALLRQGQTFGELGIFDETVYADMATAVGPVAVACIPAAIFGELASRNHSLARALGLAVAHRYRTDIARSRDLSLRSLPARLAQTLLRLADELGETIAVRGRSVARIGAMVTQSDLGLMARGSRGNVNRSLQAWQRAGWVSLRHRAILILDRDALAKLTVEEE